MRTVHEQEEVGSGCGCCCCGRLLGKELGQLGEVLKEALTVSQGASASTKPLPRRVPGNPCSSPGLGLREKAPVLGNNASQGCGQWGMPLWWPGLVSCRSGAGGAVPVGRLQQCHLTDHIGLCSPLREGSLCLCTGR